MRALGWFAIGGAMVVLILLGLNTQSRTDFMLGVVATVILVLVHDRAETWWEEGRRAR